MAGLGMPHYSTAALWNLQDGQQWILQKAGSVLGGFEVLLLCLIHELFTCRQIRCASLAHFVALLALEAERTAAGGRNGEFLTVRAEVCVRNLLSQAGKCNLLICNSKHHYVPRSYRWLAITVGNVSSLPLTACPDIWLIVLWISAFCSGFSFFSMQINCFGTFL